MDTPTANLIQIKNPRLQSGLQKYSCVKKAPREDGRVHGRSGIAQQRMRTGMLHSPITLILGQGEKGASAKACLYSSSWYD